MKDYLVLLIEEGGGREKEEEERKKNKHFLNLNKLHSQGVKHIYVYSCLF